MTPENQFLDKLASLALKGDIAPIAAFLAGIDEVIRLHPGEKQALLKDAGLKLRSALSDHLAQEYHWLTSCFLTNPDILPAIEPALIEEVVAALPNSKFPKTKKYLEQHRAPSTEAGWATRNIPQQLVLIAEAITDLDDNAQKASFGEGFRFLPLEIQRATLREANSQEKMDLVKFLSAEMAKGPLAPANKSPSKSNVPTPKGP